MKAVAIPWPKPLPLDPGRKLEGEFCKIVGGVLSPLLANVYLHYAYDLWVRAWRSRHATGDMIVVRYADDTIVGFQHRGDAERFLADLKDRLAKFALELHPDKTRLIAFGRIVAERRRARGEGRPETFDFLGFTHICAAKRGGHGFQLRRKTKRGRKWATIRQIGEALRRMRHDAIDKQGRRLAGMLEGHYAYFAVPTNIEAVLAVRHHAKVRWYLSLRRRSQRRRLTWRRMNVIVERHLPKPRILHPGPEQRFLVRHRRQEPEA
jgi:RNA-directed DNA polymerase